MRPFKLISRKIFSQILPIGGILFGVMSCTVSQTATRGYDGVYFDPNTDSEMYGAYDVKTHDKQYNEPVRIGGRYFAQNGESSQQEVYGNTSVDNKTMDNVSRRNRNSIWDDERTDVYINNYYGSGFGSFYDPYDFGMWNRPYMRFSFGWSPFYRPYYSPFHSGFYGYYSPYNNFYYPYYGGFNGYYDSYYAPFPGYYGGGLGYYPNGYYGNVYLKKYTRGKGDTNGVVVEGNRAYRGSSNSGVRRGNSQDYRSNNSITRDNSTRVIRRTDKVPVRRGNVNNSVETRPVKTRSIKRNDAIHHNTPRRSTDKIYRSNSTINRSTNTFRGSSSSNTNSSRGGGIRRR